LIFIKSDSHCPHPPTPPQSNFGPPTLVFHRSSSSQSRDHPISRHHGHGTLHTWAVSVPAFNLTLSSGTNVTSLEYSGVGHRRGNPLWVLLLEGNAVH
jgi:hypothetical protein